MTQINLRDTDVDFEFVDAAAPSKQSRGRASVLGIDVKNPCANFQSFPVYWQPHALNTLNVHFDALRKRNPRTARKRTPGAPARTPGQFMLCPELSEF